MERLYPLYNKKITTINNIDDINIDFDCVDDHDSSCIYFYQENTLIFNINKIPVPKSNNIIGYEKKDNITNFNRNYIRHNNYISYINQDTIEYDEKESILINIEKIYIKYLEQLKANYVSNLIDLSNILQDQTYNLIYQHIIHINNMNNMNNDELIIYIGGM